MVVKNEQQVCNGVHEQHKKFVMRAPTAEDRRAGYWKRHTDYYRYDPKIGKKRWADDTPAEVLDSYEFWKTRKQS